VIRVEYSPLLEAHIGMALLDLPYAYSGIDAYTVEADGESQTRVFIQTVSPPVINNRSLYVNPQKHSYTTRSSHTFPALV
jgi:hypothetical protein